MTVAPSALYQWYRETASQRPDTPAMTFLQDGGKRSVTYTYAELFARIDELSAALRPLQLGRKAPLGLLMPSQEDQVLHYLAALDAGTVPAILTPPNRKLNRAYYQQTMTVVLQRCGFVAVVSGIDDFELPTPGLEPFTFAQSGEREPASPDAAEPDLDASFMQFSSGTTGIKRGVLVSDDAVISQLRTYGDALALTADDVIASWLPLYHDMGFIACLNMPLAFGVHTVMIDPIDWVTNPLVYLQAIGRFGATLSWHPNFAFAFMAQRIRDRDLADLDLSSLRGLVNCSEPVTRDSQQAFLDRYSQVGLSPGVFKGCYAMAETTFALTHGESSDPGYGDPLGPDEGVQAPTGSRYISVGRPLPDVELRVVDPATASPVADGTVGELWVRSPFNFAGYFNDRDATSDAFVDDWYRTGDLGYARGGEFYIAGRLKDVLIVGGVNVFPQDIEDLVAEFEGIQAGRVSAFSTFDPRVQTERVVILAETTVASEEHRRELHQRVRQRVLAAFQIANFELQLVELGQLIKSTSGKMARGANRDRWLAERESA